MLRRLRQLPDLVFAESAIAHFLAVDEMGPGIDLYAREKPRRASARSAAAICGCLAALACLEFRARKKEFNRRIL